MLEGSQSTHGYTSTSSYALVKAIRFLCVIDDDVFG